MLLCYIFLLHQTTTWNKQNDYNLRCVISFFYIKPQLSSQVDSAIKRCVISFFYIKPQLTLTIIYALRVVLYLSSTSNHNNRCERSHAKTLCYIFLLHQTTTFTSNKSQIVELCYIFLLHQTTTPKECRVATSELCYIFLLHQTTTDLINIVRRVGLCYIFLLHQTTTAS